MPETPDMCVYTRVREVLPKRESDLEARLVRGVKTLGGLAYKFTSPGNTGVPDRLVVLSGGRVLFAELKAEDGRLSRIQRYQIDRLRSLGAEVWVVQGEAGVRDFLEACRRYTEEGGTG